jgi:hypothetical protein
MDYCYNNPVMHVFSHLLKKSAEERSKVIDEGNVELVGTDALVEDNSRGTCGL